MDNQLLAHLADEMRELRSDIKLTRESQIRMEVDVAYHIKRTNLLEAEVKELRNKTGWAARVTDLTRCVLKACRLIK